MHLKAMSLTIAHYRLSKIAFKMAFVLFMIVLAFGVSWFAFENPNRIFHSVRSFFLIPMLLGLWISTVIVLRDIWETVQQILFHGRRAVWIDDGALIFLRPSFFSVSCGRINRFAFGVVQKTGEEAIIANFMDGTQMALPSATLLESRDIVVDRLNKAIDGWGL